MTSAPRDEPVDDDAVVAYFDSHAAAYDRQLWMERSAVRVAARMAAAAPGERVLDVATGTGAVARAVLEDQPAIGTLTVVDAAPHMLERAAVRLRRRHPAVRLMTADARALPLDDGSVDLATVGYLLHLLGPDDRRAVLAEVARVVRPGGRVVVIVHGTPPTDPLAAVYRAGWALVDRLSPGRLVGRGPMRDAAVPLGEAGFDVTATRRLPGVYWSQVVAAAR